LNVSWSEGFRELIEGNLTGTPFFAVKKMVSCTAHPMFVATSTT
jgi:hypothetical protein